MIDEAKKSVWKCFYSFILTLQIGCAKFTEADARACKAGTEYSVPVSSQSELCHIPAYLLVSQCTMMAHQWNGNASSICPSSQTSGS